MRKPKILLLNGSLHGDSDNSNTLLLLQQAERELIKQGADVDLVSPQLVHFQAQSLYLLSVKEVLAAVQEADGLIIGTGTHWGQSSSTLQHFLEEATTTEGSDLWLGKPAGFIVSEYSTGGQTVLSNLMLTFSNLGCTIPPQSGMVLSRTGQEAKKTGENWTDDVWGLDDIAGICTRVLAHAEARKNIPLNAWPVDNDEEHFPKRWVTLQAN